MSGFTLTVKNFKYSKRPILFRSFWLHCLITSFIKRGQLSTAYRLIAETLRTAKHTLPSSRRPHLLLLETIELCRMPISLRSRPTKGQTFYQLSLLPTYWQYKQACLLIKKVVRNAAATNSSATRYKQSFITRFLNTATATATAPGTSPLVQARQEYLAGCVAGWQLGHFRWVRTPRHTTRAQSARAREATVDGPNFIYSMSRWADITTLARLHAICRWSFGTLVTSRLNRGITPKHLSRLPIPYATNLEELHQFHKQTATAFNERRELHRRLHIFNQARAVTEVDILSYNSIRQNLLQRIVSRNYKWTYKPYSGSKSQQSQVRLHGDLNSDRFNHFLQHSQFWYPTRRPLDMLNFGKGIFSAQEAILTAMTSTSTALEYSNQHGFDRPRLRQLGSLRLFLVTLGRMNILNTAVYSSCLLKSPRNVKFKGSLQKPRPLLVKLPWLWLLRNTSSRKDTKLQLPTKLLPVYEQLRLKRNAAILAAITAKKKLFERKPWLKKKELRMIAAYFKKRKWLNKRRKKLKLPPLPLRPKASSTHNSDHQSVTLKKPVPHVGALEHNENHLLLGYSDITKMYTRVNNDRLETDHHVYKHLVSKQTSAFRMFMLLANNFYTPHTRS